MDLRFIGRWTSDPDNIAALNEYGQVTLEFDGKGNLKYIIHKDDKDQIMLLTYRIERNLLVIDQPSAPKEHKTSFYFKNNGRLALQDEGIEQSFIKLDTDR